jgi:hypothetical protein
MDNKITDYKMNFTSNTFCMLPSFTDPTLVLVWFLPSPTALPVIVAPMRIQYQLHLRYSGLRRSIPFLPH